MIQLSKRPARQKTFSENAEVDFVIVGSGAAGGVLAKELSTAGFDVVVLEQGGWPEPGDYEHDELAISNGKLLNTSVDPVQTFRKTEAEKATVTEGRGLTYRRGVGGSSAHFTANFWRLRPIDFHERSVYGSIPGSSFADWPITYEELEPYYSKVEWEIGVSGAPGPFDAYRSRPYPMPPLPLKSSGALLEKAAAALGLHAQVAPMAITSQQYDGRSACMACGRCMAFLCEYGAKSSSLVTVIPKAQATGRCEIRTNATVFRVETNAKGRATGVLYWDNNKNEHRQRAKAVVLAANGAETARLLLMSTSPLFPHGLANSNGQVGRNIMFNAGGSATGRFKEPLNEFKGHVVSRIIMDFYNADSKRGFYGGGGIDARFPNGPLGFAQRGGNPKIKTWGAEYVNSLRDYAYITSFSAHTTSLAVETNSVSLDPDHVDRWGRPVLRLTYTDHPDDMKSKAWFQARAKELMEAAGAEEVWTSPIRESNGSVHLLGTARMGNDPRESVVNRDHRAHDVPNLFVCDGSSLVTSTRGQPTMTIQALAFRAGDRITQLAKGLA